MNSEDLSAVRRGFSLGGDWKAVSPEILGEVFDAALANVDGSSGPRFTWAYQPSFALAASGNDILDMRPTVLSAFLRLDLGDGGPLLEPKNGLIPALIATRPRMLGQLDRLALKHAAAVSIGTRKVVTVNLGRDVTPDDLKDELASHPQRAELMGEVVLTRLTVEKAVSLAQDITNAGARFKLSNVTTGEQLTEVLHALEEADLRPAGADMDFGIGRDLGMPDEQGRVAHEAAAGILRAARDYDPRLVVSVTGVAMGTPEARRDLFAAVDEAGYPVDRLSVSGRDLGAETTDVSRLPTLQVSRSSGEVLTRSFGLA